MDIRGYLWSLTLTCVAAAVVRAAAGSGVLKKNIDLICSLCIICAVIVPVAREFSVFDAESIGELFENSEWDYGDKNWNEIYNSYLCEGSTDLAEQTLESGLSERLGMDINELNVILITDTSSDTVRVSEVTVELSSGAYTADPEIIKNYILEQTGVMCRIIYK